MDLSKVVSLIMDSLAEGKAIFIPSVRKGDFELYLRGLDNVFYSPHLNDKPEEIQVIALKDLGFKPLRGEDEMV